MLPVPFGPACVDAYGYERGGERVWAYHDACHCSPSGEGVALVEGESAEAVKGGYGVAASGVLHDVGMVAYDGVGSCAGEDGGLCHLLHRGLGLELHSPVEYAGYAVGGVPPGVFAHGAFQLAERGLQGR